MAKAVTNENLAVPLAKAGMRPWLAMAAVCVAIFVLRLVYLRWLCPYELAEDEAFYWEWSQHLAWSYNTKGPGIAWAIGLATWLLGTSEFAVRAVAATAGLIGGLAAGAATLELSGNNRRAGVLGALVYHLIPGFAASAVLSTIDGPYLACWAVACWALVRAVKRDSPWAFALMGWAIGVGFLFKYTIVLLPLGFVLAWVLVLLLARTTSNANASTRAWQPSRWGIAGLVVGLLVGVLPVLIWNAQHDWPTVKHLLGHLGLSVTGERLPGKKTGDGGWSYQPRWTLELIAVQLAIIGPVMIAMITAAVALWRQAKGKVIEAIDARQRWAGLILMAAALPIFAFYLGVTVLAGAEGNWPMAGFVSLIPVVVCWWFGGRPLSVGAGTRLSRSGVHRFFLNATMIYGVIAVLGMLRLDWVKAGLEGVSAGAAKAVPLGRLIGGKAMAAHVSELAAAHKAADGRDAVILAQHYGRGSQLAFYLSVAAGSYERAPRVYVAQSRLGGRNVQQDYWPSHDVDGPHLMGRPAIIIADFDSIETWSPHFASVVRLGELRGGTRGSRWGFVGVGFRGLPMVDGPQRY